MTITNMTTKAKCYQGTHYFDEQDNEYVEVANGPTYRVDRKLEQLINVADPQDVLELQEQQFDGDGELLERYAASDDPERDIVIDSTPDWLTYIRSF